MTKEVKSEVKQDQEPSAAKKRKREPLEVMVYDRWTGNWLHAEYRGEVNRKSPEPRYKVYSPFFVSLDKKFKAKVADLTKAHRWVPSIKIRGLAPDEVEEFLRKDALEAAMEDIFYGERLESDYPSGSIGPLVRRFPEKPAFATVRGVA